MPRKFSKGSWFISAEVRFEMHTEKVQYPKDSCWNWTGPQEREYGILWDGERNHRAHRWAYEHFVGPIPEGLEIDHLCFNTLCVNPKHLEPVTHEENLKRMHAHRRKLKRDNPEKRY